MAWISVSTSSFAKYRTKLQVDLIKKIKDPSVMETVNDTIYNHYYAGLKHYVPMNSSRFLSRNDGDAPGRLRNSVEITANGIKWRTPYAHYVWEGAVYGPNIPIHAKGNSKQIVGFYSIPGSTKSPTGKRMKYSTPGTISHWTGANGVDEIFSGGKGRVLQNAITKIFKDAVKGGN